MSVDAGAGGAIPTPGFDEDPDLDVTQPGDPAMDQDEEGEADVHMAGAGGSHAAADPHDDEPMPPGEETSRERVGGDEHPAGRPGAGGDCGDGVGVGAAGGAETLGGGEGAESLEAQGPLVGPQTGGEAAHGVEDFHPALETAPGPLPGLYAGLCLGGVPHVHSRGLEW